jgi:hypothetical protein
MKYVLQIKAVKRLPLFAASRLITFYSLDRFKELSIGPRRTISPGCQGTNVHQP